MSRLFHPCRLALLLAIALGAAGCSVDRGTTTPPEEQASGEVANQPQPSAPVQTPAKPVVAERLRQAETKKSEIGSGLAARAAAPLAYERDMYDLRQPSAPTNRDRFARINANPIHVSLQEPVSTFSIDVDSGSYALVRRALSEGRLPPTDAVRVEELINYFDYDYPQPHGNAPFSVVTEVGPTPWHANTRLVHVGIKGNAVAGR